MQLTKEQHYRYLKNEQLKGVAWYDATKQFFIEENIAGFEAQEDTGLYDTLVLWNQFKKAMQQPDFEIINGDNV